MPSDEQVVHTLQAGARYNWIGQTIELVTVPNSPCETWHHVEYTLEELKTTGSMQIHIFLSSLDEGRITPLGEQHGNDQTPSGNA